MPVLLDEIDEIINKFNGEQRKKLVDSYIQIAKEHWNGDSEIGKKHIELLKWISKYLLKPDRDELVEQVINTKVVQARTYILDNAKEDFSEEKEFFSRVSKWMIVVIDDINEIFNFDSKTDLELFKIYNEKFLEEIVLIFCSCEKFNSAGNQLLLDLFMYKNSYEKTLNPFDFKKVFDRIYKNFNPRKSLKMNEIEDIYDESQKTKR